MGRKAVWPPKVQPHAASGQDRVRYLGVDHYLGKSGSPEARAKYVRLVGEWSAGRKPEPASGQPTVAAVVAAWRAHQAQAYPHGDEARQYDYTLDVLLAVAPGVPADEFCCDHLEQVREAMLARGWCRNVVNRRVIRVRTVWRWAERKRLAPRGSWAGLRALPPLPAGEGRRTARVRPAEWPDVAAVCRRVKPSVRGLLLAQWFTGARPGELFGLRAGQLVEEGGLIVFRPASHKNAWRGHDKVILFGPRARKVLAKLLAGKGPEELVFPSRYGVAFTAKAYRKAVVRAAAKAGVSLTPYRLRHSAKRRFTREHGLDAARAMLGQASIATTDGYAAGSDMKLAAEVARKCG